MRYVVTEIEGYATMKVGDSRGARGLSAHVIDVPQNRAVVFTARTEDYSRGRSVEAAREAVQPTGETAA